MWEGRQQSEALPGPLHVVHDGERCGEMVTKSLSCVICLHPNHSVDKCYDKDNPKRVCGLDGCKSHHHPTLHGGHLQHDCGQAGGRLRQLGKNCIQEKFRKCNVTRAGATVLEDEDSYVTKWQRGIHLLTNLDRVCRAA